MKYHNKTVKKSTKSKNQDMYLPILIIIVEMAC